MKSELLTGRYKISFLSSLICVCVVAVYAGVAGHKPIPFDDRLYVTGNVHVLQGLTWSGVVWAWTNFEAANWHPVTWLSHMVDWELFGAWIGPVMIQNAGWHIVNSILVFALLRRLFGREYLAFALTLIFALHPQNVESVAWLSQRKSQLAMFFLLCSVILYYDWREARRRSLMIFSLTAFFLSLASKPMGVCLPPILLVGEWLRLVSSKGEDLCGGMSDVRLWMKGICDLLWRSSLWLFFVVALVVSLATFWAQREAGAMSAMDQLSIGSRLANVAISIGVYVNTFVVPADLSFFYPLSFDFDSAKITYGIWLLLVFFAVAFAWYKKQPVFVLGGVWFGLAHLPTIGLVQVGSQSHADRYMYLPMIGLLIMAGVIVQEVSCRARDAAGVVRWSVAWLTAFALGMGANAYAYLFHWHNAEAAYRRSLDVAGPSYMMLTNMAAEMANKGYFKSALQFGKAAEAIQPDSVLVLGNIGMICVGMNDYAQAITYLRRAVELAPELPQYHYNLGLVLVLDGQEAAGIESFKVAKRLLPDQKWDLSYDIIRRNLDNISGFVKGGLGAARGGSAVGSSRAEAKLILSEEAPAFKSDPSEE